MTSCIELGDGRDAIKLCVRDGVLCCSGAALPWRGDMGDPVRLGRRCDVRGPRLLADMVRRLLGGVTGG